MRHLSAFLQIILASAAHAQYQAGYVWNRDADWSGGTRHGGSWRWGNPDADEVGNEVWSYEICSGGGALDSANPWYREPTTLATWDASWYGGAGLWSQGDNSGPPLARQEIVHDRGLGGLFGRTPLVRWTNPTRETISVGVSGQLRVTWAGNAAGCPVVVDVVVARLTEAGAYTELLAATVSKPLVACTVGDYLELPMDVSNLGVGARDQIVVSIRARESVAGQWVILRDAISITLMDVDACQADFNGDGFVDFFDYDAFVEAFETGC